MTKPLPQSLESERDLIGAVMLAPDVLDLAEVARLAPSDFMSEKHGRLWRLILGMADREVGLSVVHVCNAVMDQGIAEQVGGIAYVASLPDAVPSIEIAGYHARRVAADAVRRRVIQQSTETIAAAYNSGLDIADLVTVAQRPVATLERGMGSGSWAAVRDVVEQVYIETEQRVANGGAEPGIWAGPISRLACFMRGDMWSWGGRTGMGKTAAVLTAARLAAEGNPHDPDTEPVAVGIFSLEMGKLKLATRLAAGLAKIPVERIRTGDLSRADLRDLRDAADHIGRLPIYIDETPGLTPQDIRARAHQLKVRAKADGHDLGIVVVDHLGLVKSKGHDLRERTTDAANEMLALAKRVDACVWQVVQLNRGPEHRENHRPKLSDIREAGQVEENSRGIIFVHREAYYSDNPHAHPMAGFGEWIIGKQNDGATGSMHMEWLGPSASWGSVEVDRHRLAFAQ